MSGKKTLALLLAAVISASGIVSVAADTEDVVTYEQLEECTVEMEKFLDQGVDEYATESIDFLNRAFAYAQDVLDDEDATTKDYTNAYFMMYEAHKALEKYTLEDLAKLVRSCRSTYQTDNILNEDVGDELYDIDVWDEFVAVYDEAQDLIDMEEDDLQEISNVYLDLQKAYENLEKNELYTVSKTSFSSLIRKADSLVQDQDKYAENQRGTAACKFPVNDEVTVTGDIEKMTDFGGEDGKYITWGTLWYGIDGTEGSYGREDEAGEGVEETWWNTAALSPFYLWYDEAAELSADWDLDARQTSLPEYVTAYQNLYNAIESIENFKADGSSTISQRNYEKFLYGSELQNWFEDKYFVKGGISTDFAAELEDILPSTQKNAYESHSVKKVDNYHYEVTNTGDRTERFCLFYSPEKGYAWASGEYISSDYTCVYDKLSIRSGRSVSLSIFDVYKDLVDDGYMDTDYYEPDDQYYDPNTLAFFDNPTTVQQNQNELYDAYLDAHMIDMGDADERAYAYRALKYALDDCGFSDEDSVSGTHTLKQLENLVSNAEKYDEANIDDPVYSRAYRYMASMSTVAQRYITYVERYDVDAYEYGNRGTLDSYMKSANTAYERFAEEADVSGSTTIFKSGESYDTDYIYNKLDAALSYLKEYIDNYPASYEDYYDLVFSVYQAKKEKTKTFTDEFEEVLSEAVYKLIEYGLDEDGYFNASGRMLSEKNGSEDTSYLAYQAYQELETAFDDLEETGNESSEPSGGDTDVIKGDVNGDGKIDLKDVMLTLNIYMGKTVPAGTNQDAVSGLDGNASDVSLRDLMAVLNLVKNA